MLKKITMVMLAVSALAISAPAASADGHLSGDCAFDSVPLGPAYAGVVVGYGTNSTGGPVTVHCEVRVGDWEQTSTGSGAGVAVTAGTISFTADDSETIHLCVVVTDGLSTYESCAASTPWEPPLDELLWLVRNEVEPRVCPELAKLQGSYAGVVTVHPDGDVWVNGTRQVDCAPYDN